MIRHLCFATSLFLSLFLPAQELKPINGTMLFVKAIGQGEPLLVVHGGPGLNHTYLQPHLDDLSEDFQVIFYDQRASGQSEIPSPDSISIDFFANDMEGIRQSLNVDKVTILAHSWGAIPAVAYASKNPDKVKGLILCNAVPLNKSFDAEITETQRSRMSSRDSTDRSILLGSPRFKAGDVAAYKKVLLLSFRNSFYKPSHFHRLNFTLPSNFSDGSKALAGGLGKELTDYDYYDKVKQFSFPVLVLHGEADAIPLKVAQQADELIPNSSLEVFKKSGHFIFIEENRKFNAVVRKFIKNPQ